MVTAKADVWSYGVVIWEVFHRIAEGTYKLPYEELSYDFFVIRALEEHKYLEIGQRFPDDIKQILARVFKENPDERPELIEILDQLSHLL